jgi:ADP-heptose:LPS heptosyltransferase
MKYLVQRIFVPFLFIIDLIGGIIFSVFSLKSKRKKPAKMQKVLFIRLEHIGDMVMATPVFETWKKNHPECEVHVLCKSLTKPIIQDSPFVDKILTYDAPWFHKRDQEKDKGFLETIRSLRKENYDMVFEMHGDLRNNYLAYKTESYTVGYSCRGGGFLLDEVVEYTGKIHNIRQNLKLIGRYCRDIMLEPKLFTNKAAKVSANNMMRKYGLRKNSFVIINPLSGRKEKDLSHDEVASISKKISLPIIITGSRSQRQENDRFCDGKRIINMSGTTNLQELIELVRNSKKVISSDTGIVHIAHALKVPLEVKYKTTDRSIWGY